MSRTAKAPPETYDLDRVYQHGYAGLRYRKGQLSGGALAAYQQGAEHKAAGKPATPPSTVTPDEDTAATTDGAGGSPSSADAAGAGATRRPRRAARIGGLVHAGPKVSDAAADLITRPATLGGDGGGLLLAVFVYPIVLSMLQHGPAGLGMWLKAKFLNQTSSTSSTSGTTSSTGKVTLA